MYGKPFCDDRLLAYVGELVKVSADICDLRSITVYDKRGKPICEALEA